MTARALGRCRRDDERTVCQTERVRTPRKGRSGPPSIIIVAFLGPATFPYHDIVDSKAAEVVSLSKKERPRDGLRLA